MAAITKTCIVHGTGCDYKNARHAPLITLKFTANATRSGDKIKVTLTNMVFQAHGGYGFPMTVYAKVTDSGSGGSWTKLDKSTATTAVTWKRKPSNKSFTVTCKDTTVYIHIGAYAHDEKGCYGSGTKQVARYLISVPAYAATVTYNANGGTNAPAAQEPTPGSTIVVSGTQTHTGPEDQPNYRVTIRYYHYESDTWVYDGDDVAYQIFNGWLPSTDPYGNLLQPGDNYTANSPCTMTAQWGGANMHTRWADIYTYMVTCVPNNGEESFILDVSKSMRYNTSIYGDGADYYPNTDIVVNADLRLYLFYDNYAVLTQELVDYATRRVHRPGYRFDGWYLDSALTIPVADRLPMTIYGNDTVLYAKWFPEPVFQFTDGEWKQQSIPLVWKFNASANEWQQIAPLFRFDEDHGWICISE